MPACLHACRSDLESASVFDLRRILSAVISWTAIALVRFPATGTLASLGCKRSVLLVSGTTITRLKLRLTELLLATMPERVLQISLPTAGSNSTHHTSSRSVG